MAEYLDIEEVLLEIAGSSNILAEATTPLSCKSKRDLWGRPMLWNDKAQECRSVSRRLLSHMKAAQKKSAEAVSHSQQTTLGMTKHKAASETNAHARELHKKAAEEFHKSGFASVGNAHLKQAGLHHRLVDRHDARHKDTSPRKASEDSAPTKRAPEPLKRSNHGRDHRGRFSPRT